MSKVRIILVRKSANHIEKVSTGFPESSPAGVSVKHIMILPQGHKSGEREQLLVICTGIDAVLFKDDSFDPTG